MRWVVCLAVCGVVFGAGAQEEAEMNSKVYDYFQRQADGVTPKLAWNATTKAEHEAWRAQFEPKLRELLGRTPERVPLEVKWDEKMETDAFTRHKIYVRSEKDYWIPAYYFVPKKLKEKAPAILCFHGHSGIYPYIGEGTEAERKKSVDHELDYAVKFAEAGYVTLAPIQRGWNETRNETPHSCHRVTMDAFLIGMTAIGLRVWDGSRLTDFLETRDEVDASRIAAAGLSGGGTTTLFFSALEPRVRAAMCAGYFCTFRHSIFTIHHCICNCIPHMMEWGEMSDVGALIAPRPLLVISGDKDRIFPIDATKAAFEKLSETYAVLGAEDNIESDFFEGVHQWSNRKAPAFADRHLRAGQ